MDGHKNIECVHCNVSRVECLNLHLTRFKLNSDSHNVRAGLKGHTPEFFLLYDSVIYLFYAQFKIL